MYFWCLSWYYPLLGPDHCPIATRWFFQSDLSQSVKHQQIVLFNVIQRTPPLSCCLNACSITEKEKLFKGGQGKWNYSWGKLYVLRKAINLLIRPLISRTFERSQPYGFSSPSPSWIVVALLHKSLSAEKGVNNNFIVESIILTLIIRDANNYWLKFSWPILWMSYSFLQVLLSANAAEHCLSKWHTCHKI